MNTEQKHIETIEEAIGILRRNKGNEGVVSKLNRLIGYLTAVDEINNPTLLGQRGKKFQLPIIKHKPISMNPNGNR